jgi:hypothetical protein
MKTLWRPRRPQALLYGFSNIPAHFRNDVIVVAAAEAF